MFDQPATRSAKTLDVELIRFLKKTEFVSDTQADRKSQQTESYVPSKNNKTIDIIRQPSLSIRRGSKFALLSLSVLPVLSPQGDYAAQPKELDNQHTAAIVEPVGETSNFNSFVNHQVPLISRVPSKIMKRPVFRRKSPLIAKKILQQQEPVLAHLRGDDCGESSLIPESAIDAQLQKITGELQLGITPNLSKLRPAATISSAGETFQFGFGRKIGDESSVRMPSLKGSELSIQKSKTPYLLAPVASQRGLLSPDRWRSANSNNFGSLRYKLDLIGPTDQGSHMVEKSNICFGRPPTFEVSRMQLMIPSNLRAPSLRMNSFTENHETLGAREAQLSRCPSPMKSQLLQQASPALDTIPDLEAMIQECGVLQKAFTKSTRKDFYLAPQLC